MVAFRHQSVLPDEAVAALCIRPDGVYVDATLGGGGHALRIAEKLPGGKLVGIDRDPDALAAAQQRVPALTALHGSFHDLTELLHAQQIHAIDGILFDLGVSSHQVDTPERGFSYRLDGPLDMRMNPTQGKTAADIINHAPQAELERILFQYGEEKHTRRIVRTILAAREKSPITTTQALVQRIEAAIPVKIRDKHPAMRTFMALRIAVNDELAPLEKALRDAVAMLRPAGRIAVITFHSLEDRIVKHTFRAMANPCTCPRDIPFCACGQVAQVRVITRQPILPTEAERAQNPRANSAKLRVAEKLPA